VLGDQKENVGLSVLSAKFVAHNFVRSACISSAKVSACLSLFAARFLHLALDVFDEISVNHIVPIRWIKSDRCNAYYKLQHMIESVNFSFIHQNRSISESDCVA